MTKPIASEFVAFAALLLTGSLTAQWTELAPSVMPSARFLHGMVLDQARDVVVLFGGNDSGSGSALGDTWEWDGTSWTQKFPNNSPSARWAHCMAWDSVTGNVLLFGGDDIATLPGNSMNDTWSYDGTDWTQLSPATSPGNRSYARCATDILRQRIVLFGGWDTSDPNTPILGGTWEWDGNTWIERFPANSPSDRRMPAMGFNLVQGVVVLDGGYDGNGVLGDTWAWDGTDWTNQSILGGTSAGIRHEHHLVYEPHQDNGSTFGGNSGNVVTGVYSDTWQRVRNATWYQTATSGPQGRSRYGMAKRPGGQPGVVMFGGMTFSITPPTIGFVPHGDMWTWVPRTLNSWTPLGTGCAGSAGTPVLDAHFGPAIGQSYAQHVSHMPAGGTGIMAFGLASLQTPMQLQAFGLPGCSLYIDVRASEFFVAIGETGTVSLNVPLILDLCGLPLHSQALILDPGAGNAADATMSNASIGIVGL